MNAIKEIKIAIESLERVRQRSLYSLFTTEVEQNLWDVNQAVRVLKKLVYSLERNSND